MTFPRASSFRRTVPGCVKHDGKGVRPSVAEPREPEPLEPGGGERPRQRAAFSVRRGELRAPARDRAAWASLQSLALTACMIPTMPPSIGPSAETNAESPAASGRASVTTAGEASLVVASIGVARLVERGARSGVEQELLGRARDGERRAAEADVAQRRLPVVGRAPEGRLRRVTRLEPGHLDEPRARRDHRPAAHDLDRDRRPAVEVDGFDARGHVRQRGERDEDGRRGRGGEAAATATVANSAVSSRRVIA